MPVFLFGGLLLILVGAELFTNAAEWLSKKFNFSNSITGSVLAAVGTALPESIIPIAALYHGEQMQIATGALVGAPFMLGTLAFGVCAIAAMCCGKREFAVAKNRFSFDLAYILLCFALFFMACFGGVYLQRIIAVLLLWAYAYYLWRMFKIGDKSQGKLRALYLSPKATALMIMVQLALGLGLIIGGAELFVRGITIGSKNWGISPLILTLILAPIATELPEKFNSVIWILQGKDDLALGNITGAMVFQCTVIPALIMLKVPIDLDLPAIYSAVILALSLGGLYLMINLQRKLRVSSFLSGFLWYGVFIGLICWSVI